MADNNKENTATKQLAMRKINANELHESLGHPREDRMRATEKYLKYNIKRTIYICEECAMEKARKIPT